MESAQLRRAPWLLIKWTFLFMGPLFLGGALISAHYTQKFLRESVTTQGRIVALKPVRSSRDNSISFAPVFRFDVPGWHFTTVVSHTSANPPAFKPGEMVTVHYKQGHPDDAVIDSFEQLWLGDWVFGSVGALFTAVGLLVLMYGRRGEPRDIAAANDGSGITRL